MTQLQPGQGGLSCDCDVCGPTFGHVHEAREMMFGLGGTFRYWECSRCGSLHLLDPPQDLSPFYENYYSLAAPSTSVRPFKRFVYQARGALLRRVPQATAILRKPGSSRAQWTEWFSWLEVGRDSDILDVGAGSGALLHSLRRHGFRSLTGTDPYLEEPTDAAGVQLLNKPLTSLHGRHFDLIMMNHSIEHVDDPLPTLRAARSLMRPNGHLLVRTPVAGSCAWRTYGVDWVQLDAPRHLNIYTPFALEALAWRAGLRLTRLVFDSGAEQFWASEQYRLGIAAYDNRSHYITQEHSPFRPDQIRQWRKRARELNAAMDGDQAAYVFSVGVPGTTS